MSETGHPWSCRSSRMQKTRIFERFQPPETLVSSDAKIVWPQAADRNTAVASGTGGLQSTANFCDEIGRQSDTCLITRSENSGLTCFMPARDGTGLLRRNGKASGSNAGSNFAFATPGFLVRL